MTLHMYLYFLAPILMEHILKVLVINDHTKAVLKKCYFPFLVFMDLNNE